MSFFFHFLFYLFVVSPGIGGGISLGKMPTTVGHKSFIILTILYLLPKQEKIRV